MTDSSHVRYQLSDLIVTPHLITTVPDPTAMIAQVCQDTTWWLDALTTAHDIHGIARVRRQVVRLERLVRDAHLKRAALLDVAELARRAERALGLAIRYGQAHGTIRHQGQKPGVSDAAGLISPGNFAPKEVLARGAYIFAGVSDEAFEAAIAASRTANDLGRSDVIRRVTGKPRVGGRPVPSVRRTREATAIRRARIKEMAEAGHNSHQIGRDVGIDPQTVRRIAREELGITIPADAFVKSSKLVNPNRVIDETVMGVDGHVTALSLLDGLWDSVDRDKVDGWISSLNASLTSLQGLRRQLKELIHDDN
jgi:hypothetical protein